MQSILQYRRFGRHVEKQLEQIQRGLPEGFGTNVFNEDTPERTTSGVASDPAKETPNRIDPEKGYPFGRNADIQADDDEETKEAIEEHDENTCTISQKDVELQLRTANEQTNNPLQTALSRISTAKSAHSVGTKIGLSLTGIEVRDRTTNEGGNRDRQVFVVGYQGSEDPLNPHNWSNWTRFFATVQIATVGGIVGLASSIDSSAVQEAAEEFGVSEVVESLATGLFLAGFGCGALIAGPMSETVGRNPVYIVTMALYMVFVMASGLSPNIGSQLTFRFLAGIFGSTPLVTAGGSIADMWSPLERVYAFPIFANAAFMGPILGPVMGGYIASSSLISWRWVDWITLIISGLVLVNLILFQPETYPGVLLRWKASHLRRLTKDDRFVAPMEIREETFMQRVIHALYRPFILTAQEPIILLVALYLTVIYIILFGFLDGYTFIYSDIHGTSQGVTGLCFLGIGVGLCVTTVLVPLIYAWAKAELEKLEEQGGGRLSPEFRLWFAMLGGAFAIPISLFWMAWTSYPSISIWSPIIASIFFGFGILAVFISSFQYVIDAYETYAASALASITLIRYIAAGGAAVWGIPFYKNLGVQWALTVLALISLLMVPVPYVFYFYGANIRRRSRYAANPPEIGS